MKKYNDINRQHNMKCNMFVIINLTGLLGMIEYTVGINNMIDIINKMV